MGRWLERFLRKKGSHVKMIGKGNKEGIEGSDLVVIAVSLEKTKEAIREISPFVSKNTIVVEISSIKNGVTKDLRNLGCRWVSIHQLFGPGKRCLKGTDIIVIKGGDKTANDFVTSLFKESRITFLDEEEHDKMMAYSLVLPYILNMVFLRVSGGKRIIKTTSFSKQRELAKRIESDWKLVSEICGFNPHTRGIINEILKETNNLKKSLKNIN